MYNIFLFIITLLNKEYILIIKTSSNYFTAELELEEISQSKTFLGLYFICGFYWRIIIK